MKHFKEFLKEAKLTRKKASDVEKGDVIQKNVKSAKDLDKMWGEVTSVERKGEEVIIKMSHVSFPNGIRKEKGTSETYTAMDRQVFAVREE